MPPEAKINKSLRTLFTMVAVRIILDQMVGSRHRQPIYVDFVAFLDEHPIRDGAEWLKILMKHEQPRMRMLALRIIEVRKAFAEEEFDWKRAEEIGIESIKEDTLSFQRKLLEDTFDDGMFGSFDESSEEEEAEESLEATAMAEEDAAAADAAAQKAEQEAKEEAIVATGAKTAARKAEAEAEAEAETEAETETKAEAKEEFESTLASDDDSSLENELKKYGSMSSEKAEEENEEEDSAKEE